tara:strand:- start:343 stop:1038 length:696 start_codon:yes stop_codon:yes gene_type:complete
MLALKQALSLVSTPLPKWTPVHDESLVAWWQHATGITDGGSPNYRVSQWDDQSDNDNHFKQSQLTERPVNGTGATSGVLTFTPAASENLDTTSQISLAGDFTIGVALYLAAGGGVLLADNTTSGEFIRFFSTTVMRIKIDNATAVDITKDEGNFLEKGYLVLTRTSDLITLHWNGVAQADTETLSGTADIDNLGLRRTDTNPYDGTVSEVMIFSSSSAALTAEVNARLSLI